jgi:hypothetical protein
MYRKWGVALATGVFLMGALSVNVHAQSPTPTALPVGEVFDYDQAYSDYVFASDTYETAHSAYLLTRAQYLQAKTLVAETRARDSAVLMLQARDEVVITYLIALRVKLSDNPGISQVTKNGYVTRLDTEISWYRDHKDKISSVGTLPDVEEDSDEASERFERVTLLLLHEVLSEISLGKLGVVRSEITELLGDIKVKASEIRSKGDHDVTTVERWIAAAESKITRALDKEIEAQSAAQAIVELRVKSDVQYNKVIDLTNQSLQLLKESSSNIKEIIRSIRTKS